MTEEQRETPGGVRSASVAHFLPAEWRDVATHFSADLERADRALARVQLLVTVPAAADAAALAREMRLLHGARDLRILPVSAQRRAVRVLRSETPHVVIGSPAALVGLRTASALKLDDVRAILVAAADEYDADEEALATLLTDAPKAAARILTATAPTALVERLLERHFHRARRVGDAAAPAETAPGGTGGAIGVLHVADAAPFARLGELLEEVDPPSAVIVAGDDRLERLAREELASLGYDGSGTLVSVSRGPVTADTALAVLAGVPSAASLRAVFEARPARVIAMVSERARGPLRAVAAAAGRTIQPHELPGAARAMLAAEEGLRSRLRAMLSEGVPAREIMTLEPLLDEHDGVAIAAAAIRLYERERLAVRDARRAGKDDAQREERERRALQPPVMDRRPPRGGPPRGGPSRGGPPRGGAPRDGFRRDKPRDGGRGR